MTEGAKGCRTRPGGTNRPALQDGGEDGAEGGGGGHDDGGDGGGDLSGGGGGDIIDYDDKDALKQDNPNFQFHLLDWDEDDIFSLQTENMKQDSRVWQKSSLTQVTSLQGAVEKNQKLLEKERQK